MDPTTPVSIATPEVEQTPEPIAIATPESPVPAQVDGDIAARRAGKMSVAVPELNKDYQAIYGEIAAGRELQLRQEAAYLKDLNTRTKQQQAINMVAGQEGRRLTLPEAMYIKEVARMKLANPDTVVEEGFAQKFFDSLRTQASNDPDSWLAESFKINPEQTNAAFEVGTDLKTKKEAFQTLHEKAQAALHNQSIGGFGVDLLKQAFPGYNEVKLRGLVNGTSSLDGLLGTNLDKQTSDLYFDPKGIEKATAIVDKLIQDNPSVAVTFTSALLGQSYSEKLWNNAFTAVDAIGVGQGVKGAIGIAKGLKTAGQAKTLIKDVVQASSEISTRAGIEETAGNVTEAAVQQATEQFIKSAKGSDGAISEAVARLQSAFNPTIEAIKENKRGLSQELVNRLVDEYTVSRDKFITAVTTQMTVERLPAVFAVQENVRKIKDGLAAKFGGLKDSILDIKIRKGELNDYYADFYLGKSDATIFSSEGVAKAFAKDNLVDGANIVEIQGPPNAKYVSKTTWKGSEGEKVVQDLKETYQGKGKDQTVYQKIKIDGKERFVPKDEVTTETRPVLTQKGAGYYIVATKPLNETDSIIRDALIATNMTKTDGSSLLNTMGGWLGSARTPEEILSMAQNVNRKVAAYGPSNFMEVIKESSKNIKALKSFALPFTSKRQKFKDWERVMAASERETGMPSFRDPQEFSDLFQRIHQRAPDEQEIAAAFDYKRKAEMLDTFDKMQEFKNKHREGAMHYKISVSTSEGETEKIAGKAKTIEVNAVPLKGLPPEDGESVLAIRGKMGQEGATTTRHGVFKSMKEEIENGKAIVLRLTDPHEYPFRNFFNEVRPQRFKYVVMRRSEVPVEETLLRWEEMKGVGFPKIDYDHYVSQAIIKRDPTSGFHNYEGDRHIAAFNVRAMAKDWADRLEGIRLNLANKNFQGAKDFYAAHNPGVEWKQIEKWFYGSVENGKPIEPVLSIDEPIRHIPYNKTIHEMDRELENVRYKGTFRNGTQASFGRYFDNRPNPNEILAFGNTGTRDNPLYNIVPTKHIDPVTSINRALVRAANDQFLNDYKTFSVEHWIQEAKKFLNANDVELANSPDYYFHNPPWKAVAGDDFKMVEALKASRFQIKQFLGVQDSMTSFVHELAQRYTDLMYTKGMKPLALDAALPALRDPFEFIRKVTFHAKLGIFALPQLIVQMQTFANIYGIAGASFAAPATKGAFFHMLSRINKSPEVLSHLDEMASKFHLPGTNGFKRGQLLEATDLMNRTGFQNVAGEHVFRDNLLHMNLMAGKGEGFLDAGAFFFREGERYSRIGAWYTSYLEARAAKPVGAFTEEEVRNILQRADLLSTNMSRASASTLHKGILSIPTQFLSYQLRLSELFFGKRLTDLERTRLMGTYAALYGVPGVFGLTGLPLGDMLRQTAIEHGYNVGEDYAQSLFAEGIPAFMAAYATGNWYNVGERFAPQGFEFLTQAFRQDKGFMDIVGGASYSTWSSGFKSMNGFYNAMASFYREDGAKFPLKLDDLIDPFKEIYAVNSAFRLAAAINTGKWISKNEGYLTDVSRSNAIFMTLSGLAPQSTADIIPKTLTMKEEKEMHQEGLKNFIKEVRRGLDADAAGNHEQAKDYYTRANAHLVLSGYPRERVGQALQSAFKDWESIVNRIDWKYYADFKNISEKRKPQALQSLQGVYKQKLENK